MISKDQFIRIVKHLKDYDAIVVDTVGVSHRYLFNSPSTLKFRRNADDAIVEVIGRGYGMLIKPSYLSEPNPRVLILSEEQFLNKFTLTKTQRLFKALKDINENKTSILS